METNKEKSKPNILTDLILFNNDDWTSYSKDNDISTLLKAVSWGFQRHCYQKRKISGAPYFTHPIGVASIALNAGVKNINVLIACLLHDVVEDTKTTIDDVKREFGKTISDIVAEVTDDKMLPREEQKKSQLIRAEKMSDEAKIVKLADKIHNLRDAYYIGPPKKWTKQSYKNYVNHAKKFMNKVKGTNIKLEKLLQNIIDKSLISIELQK